MSNRTLNEIAVDRDELDEVLASLDGDLTPELDARLDAIIRDEAAKLDRCKHWMDGQEAEAAGYDAKRAHYAKLAEEAAGHRDARKNAVKRLKGRIAFYLQGQGVKKLRADVYTFQIVTSGRPPVEVLVPVEQLPEAWQTISVTANKEAIREALSRPDGCFPERGGFPVAPASLARLGEPTLSLRVF